MWNRFTQWRAARAEAARLRKLPLKVCSPDKFNLSSSDAHYVVRFRGRWYAALDSGYIDLETGDGFLNYEGVGAKIESALRERRMRIEDARAEQFRQTLVKKASLQTPYRN